MKDIRLSFQLPESLRDQVREYARKKDMSVSAVIREALRLYFQMEE
jgi:Arc/MetJ-type ribon-helix-helix transcriptional regulator